MHSSFVEQPLVGQTAVRARPMCLFIREEKEVVVGGENMKGKGDKKRAYL